MQTEMLIIPLNLRLHCLWFEDGEVKKTPLYATQTLKKKLPVSWSPFEHHDLLFLLQVFFLILHFPSVHGHKYIAVFPSKIKHKFKNLSYIYL